MVFTLAHDKITFQKLSLDSSNKLNNSQISYRMKIEDKSIDSCDKNKILLSPHSMPLYTQIFFFILFNLYFKNYILFIYFIKFYNKNIL